MAAIDLVLSLVGPGRRVVARAARGQFEVTVVDPSKPAALACTCSLWPRRRGGVEGLIAHAATIPHAAMEPEAHALAGVIDSLLRLSVGLEGEADLADLAEGLGRAPWRRPKLPRRELEHIAGIAFRANPSVAAGHRLPPMGPRHALETGENPGKTTISAESSENRRVRRDSE